MVYIVFLTANILAVTICLLLSLFVSLYQLKLLTIDLRHIYNLQFILNSTDRFGHKKGRRLCTTQPLPMGILI